MKQSLFYSIYLLLSLVLFSACDEVLEMEMDAPYDTSVSKSELSELMVNDPALEAEIAEGLKVWRKPGIIMEDASCNNCHAPDALDLAFFDFGDDNLFRRAEPHVGAEDAQKIIDLVHAIRKKYDIDQPKDPFEFRLMQPGPNGKVLPGKTIGEREVSFAKTVIEQQMPSFIQGEINSLEKAETALQEALSVNFQDIPVGIPFPLWASDKFHGEEFGTVDEWLPNFPSLTTSRDYTLIQNEYIKNPTEENFWAMFKASKELTSIGDTKITARKIEREKFFSMLIGQHILRNKVLGIEGFVEPRIGFRRIGYQEIADFDARNDASKLPSNHIWNVAEFSRKPKSVKPNSGKYHPESIQGEMERIGYDEFFIDGNDPNWGKKDFEHRMLASWFWVHTMFHHARHRGYFNGGVLGSKYELHSNFRQIVNNLKNGFSDEEGYATWNDRWGPRATGKHIFFAENPEQEAAIKTFKVNSSWVVLYLADKFMDNEKQAFNDDGMDGVAMATNTIRALNPERADEALAMFYDICSRNEVLIQELGKPGGEALKGDCDYYINLGHNSGDGNTHTGE